MRSEFSPAAPPESLYFKTSAAPPNTQPLSGDQTAAVVVVGGGFTGVSTALHLAEAGVDVVLLEAHHIGWGATGRNGGQINPGFKHEPDEVEAKFGKEVGGRLVNFAMKAPDKVFELIDRYGIDCNEHRGGTLRAAFDESYADGIRAAYRQYKARGANVELLEADAIKEATGTNRYLVGMRDAIGGFLHPLNFVIGLSHAAINAGARIHTSSPALTTQKSGDAWIIRTPKGSVKAANVVVATNAYTDGLIPKLKRTVIPVYSSMIATDILPPDIISQILPCRSVLYEKASLTTHCRVDGLGRFLIGGRSQMREASGPESFPFLMQYAERVWPVLRREHWKYGWNGQVGVTADGYPHVHDLDGSIFVCIGYNGRGVALGTAMGEILSRRIVNGPSEPLPIPTTPISPIAFHAFWKAAVAIRVSYGRARDSLLGR